MGCKDCFYRNVCVSQSYDIRCHKFLDKSQVVLLPMKTTDWLHKELVDHCYNRCMEEL